MKGDARVSFVRRGARGLMPATGAIAAGASGAAAASAGGRRGILAAVAAARTMGATGHELVRFTRTAVGADGRGVVKNQFLKFPAAFFAAVLINGHAQSFCSWSDWKYGVSAVTFSNR